MSTSSIDSSLIAIASRSGLPVSVLLIAELCSMLCGAGVGSSGSGPFSSLVATSRTMPSVTAVMASIALPMKPRTSARSTWLE